MKFAEPLVGWRTAGYEAAPFKRIHKIVNIKNRHLSLKVILWEGFCPTHIRVQEEDVVRAKKEHPKAEVVARFGMEYYKKKSFVKARDLEPMYIYSRECDIKGI